MTTDGRQIFQNRWYLLSNFTMNWMVFMGIGARVMDFDLWERIVRWWRVEEADG